MLYILSLWLDMKFRSLSEGLVKQTFIIFGQSYIWQSCELIGEYWEMKEEWSQICSSYPINAQFVVMNEWDKIK